MTMEDRETSEVNNQRFTFGHIFSLYGINKTFANMMSVSELLGAKNRCDIGIKYVNPEGCRAYDDALAERTGMAPGTELHHGLPTATAPKHHSR